MPSPASVLRGASALALCCSCYHLPPAVAAAGPDGELQLPPAVAIVGPDAALQLPTGDFRMIRRENHDVSPSELVEANPSEDSTCQMPTGIDCSKAQPQSPRDVSPGAKGYKHERFRPWGPPGAGFATSDDLVQVNTHFHLGAEHRSAGEYDVKHGGENYKAPSDLEAEHAISKDQVGYFCRGPTWRRFLKKYEFKHCHGVEVGNTYEIHWVYASGGVTIQDGLTVTQISDNPHVAVRAQVFIVVNPEEGYDLDPSWENNDLMHTGVPAKNSVQYVGSTTGKSFNNECCSPYEVSWQVDQDCHEISAASMDNMCRVMTETYNMTADIASHASRILVSPELAVPAKYVRQLDLEMDGGWDDGYGGGKGKGKGDYGGYGGGKGDYGGGKGKGKYSPY